jgi:hypothetical protein
MSDVSSKSNDALVGSDLKHNQEWESLRLVQEINQQMDSVHDQLARRLGFGVDRELDNEV